MLTVLAAGDSYETRGLDPRFFFLLEGDTALGEVLL